MLNCLISFNTSAFRVTAPVCLRLSLLPSCELFRARFPVRSTFPILSSSSCFFLTITLFQLLDFVPVNCSGRSTFTRMVRRIRRREDASEYAFPPRSVDPFATRSMASPWPGHHGRKEITGIISEWLIDACRTSYACALAPSPSLSRSR